MSNKIIALCLVSFFCFAGCTKAQTSNPTPIVAAENTPTQEIKKIKNSAKVIHVLVALCDNENQGIVPVPAFLGNGEDPTKNLYWGAAFGVKTFFGKSKSWKKISFMDSSWEQKKNKE